MDNKFLGKNVTLSLAVVLGAVILMDLWLIAAWYVSPAPIPYFMFMYAGINLFGIGLLKYLVNHTRVHGLYTDWSNIESPKLKFDVDAHSENNVIEIFLRRLFCDHGKEYGIGFSEENRRPYRDGDHMEFSGYVVHGHSLSRCCNCGHAFTRKETKFANVKGDIIQ